MAKRRSRKARRRNSRLIGFAEDLGRILGTTQAKASSWLSQREQIAKQLTQVRDTAQGLLNELTGGGARMAAAVRGARKTALRKGAGKTSRAGRGVKRRRMSAAARKKISDAAKKRWAARKKAAAQGRE